jgi:hypothetical protein
MAPGQFEVLDEGVANQLFLLPDVHLQPFHNLIRRDGVAEYRQQRCHIQRTAWGQKLSRTPNHMQDWLCGESDSLIPAA